MHKKLFLIISLSYTTAFGAIVAECNGSDIFGAPARAQIFKEENVGRILIQTSIDSVVSSAKVDLTSTGTLFVSDNKFKMNFFISDGEIASPVQAFRDGAFFVEDFACRRNQ